jgi:transposase
VPESSGTVRRTSYASDLNDEQWALLEPVFHAPGKRGPKHGPDLRRVVDGMLYISHTGCQWRFLPESFGPWTRVRSQFRRWSRNGTWARALTVLHQAACEAEGRAEVTPSMVVIDSHLARGASNGGLTFHDRVEVAHGRLGRARRLAKSFENTTGPSRTPPPRPPAGCKSPASRPPCGACPPSRRSPCRSC